MEALNLMLKYPVSERWCYKNRSISIHRYPANEGVLHGLSLGLSMENLHIYYSVLVYDGSFLDHCHMNVPDVEIEDYAIRKELIESWIDSNLPPLKVSFWSKVRSLFDWRHTAMQGKFWT